MNRPASALSSRSVACDLSSASVICNEKTLRSLRSLREIYKSSHMDNSFSRKERRERKDSGPVTLALEYRSFARQENAEVSRKLVLIHPLPLRVLPPVSGGESVTIENTAPANCPPETGGTRSGATEGVDNPLTPHLTPLNDCPP